MGDVVEQLLDLLFPSNYPGLLDGAAGSLRTRLVAECGSDLPISPELLGGVLAGVRAGGEYRGLLKSAVLALKSGDRRIARPLSEVMLIAAGNDPCFCAPDLVCFVPSTRKKKSERGFNQAELLARLVSRRLEAPLCGALAKVRSTPDQDRLSGRERRTNLAGAFVCRSPLEGRVLLIDDVMTTGSTARACASALLAAGADGVFALVAARALLSTPTRNATLVPGTIVA